MWPSVCLRKQRVMRSMGDQPKADTVNRNRTWLVLLTACVTPALVVALGSAILFTTAAVAFAGAGHSEPMSEPAKGANQAGDSPRERIFAGLITDNHCGARHDMDSDMNPTECTRMCVRNGSRYVLIEGNKRYALTGSESMLDGLAGQRVRVSGTLDGNTINVGSLSSGH
jgi:hypothetical protein